MIYLHSRTNISTFRNPFLMVHLSSKIYVNKDVRCFIVYNSENLETTQMFINRGWLDKICHICPLEYSVLINKWSGLWAQHRKPPRRRRKWGGQAVIVPITDSYSYNKKVEYICTCVCVNAWTVEGCARSLRERSGKEGGGKNTPKAK